MTTDLEQTGGRGIDDDLDIIPEPLDDNPDAVLGSLQFGLGLKSIRKMRMVPNRKEEGSAISSDIKIAPKEEENTK